MNCQEYKDLIEDALDISLQGVLEANIQRHLEHCSECRNYLVQRRREHAALFACVNAAYSCPRRPPADFADRIVRDVAAQRTACRGWRRLSLPKWALIAASLAVVAGFVYASVMSMAANIESEGGDETVAHDAPFAPQTGGGATVLLAPVGASISSTPSTEKKQQGETFDEEVGERSEMTINMQPKSMALAASISAASMLTIAAAGVELQANDSQNTPSFAAAGNWSDGRAPHGDADYLVNAGRTLFAPVSGEAETDTFAGKSITFGDATTEGRFDIRFHGDQVICFPDARLVKGRFSHNVSSPDETGWTIVQLAGHYAVDGAFSMVMSGSDREIRLLGDLSGSSTLTVGYGGGATGQARFSVWGDNSGFTGAFLINGNDIAISVRDVDAIGTSDSLATAFDMRGGSIFECPTDGAVLSSSTRRISFVNGQTAKLAAPDGVTWTLDMPLQVNGTELRKLGAGTILIKNNNLQKPINVAEGALGFKDCTFTTAAPIEVCQYAGVVAVLDQETNTTTPVTIASVTDWPIGVGLSTPYPESAGEPRYAVAKIPVAVKPSLAVEDLRNLTPREGQLPSLALEIETEGTDHMVYVRRVRSVVRRISNDPTLDYQDPANWSDGLAPHDDADYLVDNASALCAASGDFSGGSLILSDGCKLELKRAQAYVPELRLCGGSTLCADGSVNNQTLDGTITVDSSDANPVRFVSGVGKNLTVASAISGSGQIYVVNGRTSAGQARYYVGLEGDNSAYRGKMTVRVEGGSDYSKNLVYLTVPDETALGIPDALEHDALRIGELGCLRVTNDVSLCAATRGLSFATFELNYNPIVEIAQDKTLTVTSPMTGGSRPLSRNGEGTLALGGSGHAFANQSVVLNQGAIFKPIAARSLESLQVTFRYDGALMSFDAEPSDAEMAQYGILSSRPASRGNCINFFDANVKFRVELAGIDAVRRNRLEIPFVTGSSDFIDDLMARFVLEQRWPGYKHQLKKTKVAVDGSEQYRLSIEFEHPGFTVIIR